MPRVRSVQDTPELQRVIDLPRRRVTLADGEPIVDEWTELLATPRGLARGVRALPAQALFARELWRRRKRGGGYFLYPVGTGKTWCTWVAPVIREWKRPHLILPAGLRDKTENDFAALSQDWLTPNPPPRILTLEELTQEENEDVLFREKPDGMIIDEADLLRNPESSMVVRIDRYVVAERPDVVVLSGTTGRQSVLDEWHLLAWSLGDDAPVPLDPDEATVWASAIDERKARFGEKAGVGALRRLWQVPGGRDRDDKDAETLTLVARARRAYRKRKSESPGVIIIDADSCDQPLYVRQVLAPADRKIDDAFEEFCLRQVTPGGEVVSDVLQRYRLEGELSTGMYNEWDPPPPEDWYAAYIEAGRFVRKAIKRHRRHRKPLDTEKQVFRYYRDHTVVRTWQAIKKSFKPKSVSRWLSTSVVKQAAKWALRADKPGLVWCWNEGFAVALAAATGLPYYGKKGLTDDRQYIGDGDCSRSAIVSIRANLRGRNLQGRPAMGGAPAWAGWHRNLIIHPPASAYDIEQLLGRTHRQGQTRPVYATWLISSVGIAERFDAAVAEARFQAQTSGVSQKILRADIQRVTLPSNTTSYRWARPESDDDEE